MSIKIVLDLGSANKKVYFNIQRWRHLKCCFFRVFIMIVPIDAFTLVPVRTFVVNLVSCLYGRPNNTGTSKICHQLRCSYLYTVPGPYDPFCLASVKRRERLWASLFKSDGTLMIFSEFVTLHSVAKCGKQGKSV